MFGYDISSIGYNPYMSGYGDFSGYGMNSALGYGNYGSYGMNGMYNPMMQMLNYQEYATEMQHRLEKSQANHNADMHTITQNNRLEELTEHNQNAIKAISIDGDVNKCIRELADAIRNTGDQEAICESYQKLSQIIMHKYSDVFNSNKNNNAETVRELISSLYKEKISALVNEQVDLDGDIKKYGQTAFEHGFWKNLWGKDYHNKYSEETLSIINGTRIDNKSGKDKMQKAGGYVESALEASIAPFAGALAGVGAVGVGASLGKLLTFGKLPLFKTIGKCGKFGAWAGAIGALAGDIIWQYSRN